MARSEATQLRLTTAVVILGVFLAGAAMGAGVYHWARPHRPPPPPPGLPLRELDLTPAQEEKVREITERHHGELEGVMRETFPRVRAINEQIEREVRAILTPEQQKRLDELKARRPPPPPGGPGGPGGPPPGEPPPGPPPGRHP